MKEQKQILWEWNKVSTPINKMSYGQLETIKNCLKNSHKQEWFGNSKKDILEAINAIEKYRNKQATKEAVKLIVDNRINKARKAVDKAISKSLLFNNMLKIGI